MHRPVAILVFLTAVTFASGAVAQTQAPSDSTSASGQGSALQKDPVVAMYLSATVPGLGQIYTGDRKRGLVFLASVVGAFGAAYAAWEPARLQLADYDQVAFGGNGDGLLSTLEAQNWEDGRYADTAFDRLSDGRKAGVITGAAVGAVLWVWNVLDARSRALDHNRDLSSRRTSMRLDAGRSRLGVALDVRF